MFSRQAFIKWGAILILIAVTTVKVRAQDTLCLYYSNGEFRLSEVSKRSLDNFVFAHEIKAVDSIYLVGYADSTGQKKSNLKLSQRRANAVKKYLRTIFYSDSLTISVSARGEENKVVKKGVLSHRRVEIILFYPASTIKDKEFEETNTTFSDNTCYRMADSILDLCHLNYYSKGSRRYVRLELDASKYNPKLRCYSLSAKTKYPKLVKWEQETTGEFWWKRPRYVANIKAVDFDKYGIVTVHSGDTTGKECIVCSNESSDDWYISSKLNTDAFLMQNMQIRKTILPKKMEIIVPKEYVSIEKGYYLDSLTEYPLQWEYKRGRKCAPYYFAFVPMQLFHPESFSIYTYKQFCTEYVPRAHPVRIDTIPRRLGCPIQGGAPEYNFGVEIGYWNTTSDEGYFSGYGQFNAGKMELGLKAGITSKTSLMFQFLADYHVWAIAPFPERTVSGNVFNADDQRFLSLYIGTTAASFFKDIDPRIVQDFHVGISYWNKRYGSGADRFFIQSGLGFNYLKNDQPRFISTMVGVRFRI